MVKWLPPNDTTHSCWLPNPFGREANEGATLLAVPSYSADNGVWKTTGRGYSGTKTPPDARADVGRIKDRCG